MTEYCAEYWRLYLALSSAGGKQTKSYQRKLEDLRAHITNCPECRARFNDIPAEGKAAAEINPDL